MKQIHQLIAGASVGDAITNYALEIRKILKSSGMASDIFCPYQHISPDLRGEILAADENRTSMKSKEATLLYHFSIGSEMTSHFLASPGRKVLCYHNITPEKYLRCISDQRAKVLHEGREELKKLANAPDITLAVSQFNADELIEFGFKDPEVLPLTLNESYLSTSPSRKIIRSYQDNCTNFLFVGRVSPNKKLEDVCKVFYFYNKTINPSSRLIFVGSYVGMEKYYTYLRSLLSEMGLQNVFFSGHISLEELLGYYTASTLFLCMSEHEGVCIPLIESMYFKKPVFALAKAAIPETLGGTGILIHKKDYPAIAELIHLVLSDTELVKSIVQKQSERIQHFQKNRLEKKLKSILGY